MSKENQHQSRRTVRAADLGESVLDQVERTGEPVTVLRGSRPVARLVPIQAVPSIPPQPSLVGTVEILGDSIEPSTTRRTLTLEYWQDEAWYVGQLREAPGVFGQGETLTELEENIRDAYELVLGSERPRSPDRLDARRARGAGS